MRRTSCVLTKSSLSGRWDSSATFAFTSADCTLTAAASLALTQLASVNVRERSSTTGYAREQFGPEWQDVDGNGCDTRNDILQRDLTMITLQAGALGDAARARHHGSDTGRLSGQCGWKPAAIPPATRPDTTPPAAVPGDPPPPVASDTARVWYTSAASNATVYYCDLDDGWKSLSPTNLRSFFSLPDLLAASPNRVRSATSKC